MLNRIKYARDMTIIINKHFYYANCKILGIYKYIYKEDKCT